MSEKLVLSEWVVYNGDTFNKPSKEEWEEENGVTGNAECRSVIEGKCYSESFIEFCKDSDYFIPTETGNIFTKVLSTI